MTEMICDNLSVNERDHLCFGGQDTVDLANKYGTPLYLMDEDRIVKNCRIYTDAFQRNFKAGSRVLYAGKACAFKQMYRIASAENMGIDVVSLGEIYTAKAAGFDLKNAYFHSNNKTDEDISCAMELGVGYFVADNGDELEAVSREATRRNIMQKVLIRLTPGIDPHTYDEVNTGRVDSKFGTAIETGQGEELVRHAMTLTGIEIAGFHCHVGSMVFDEDVFERSSAVMLESIALMKEKYGFVTRQLDLGGGYGVRYVDTDGYVDIGRRIDALAGFIHGKCAELNIEEPAILMEPGRSIVADAGLTMYTVGMVKHIPGYKNYVSVDGGMTDNPRYALYGSQYTCFAPERMSDKRDMVCDLVGRCCESGDVIQPDINMPGDMHRGDLVAVCTTGAYNYSMASNYNRIPRPPVVMLRGGDSYVAVRRETVEDIYALDV